MVSRNFLSERTAFVNAPVPEVGSRRVWEAEKPGGWRANSWELAARRCSGESTVSQGQTMPNENQMWKRSAQRTYLHTVNSHPLYKLTVNIETLTVLQQVDLLNITKLQSHIKTRWKMNMNSHVVFISSYSQGSGVNPFNFHLSERAGDSCPI